MKVIFKKYFFIVTSDKIVRNFGRLISLGINAMAITIFPFIFVRKDTFSNKELLNHEEIHIRQQVEFIVIGILFLHIYEYLYARYIKKFSPRESYYYTAMEQEAHINAAVFDYLKHRRPYTMVKYIFNKKKLSRDSFGKLIIKEN